MANDRKDFMCKYLAQLELPCKFDQKEAYSNEICTKCYQKNVFCIPPTNRKQDRVEKVTKWIDYEKNTEGICLECPKEEYECHDCAFRWFGKGPSGCDGKCDKEHPHLITDKCKNDDGCDSLDNLEITQTKAYRENIKIHKFGFHCTTPLVGTSGTKALCSSCEKDHQVACIKGGGLKSGGGLDQCKIHF
jgi:hypothetical protein